MARKKKPPPSSLELPNVPVFTPTAAPTAAPANTLRPVEPEPYAVLMRRTERAILPLGTCLRCLGVPHKDYRVYLTFVGEDGRPQTAIDESGKQAALAEVLFCLCRFCAATIRNCLENGTRLTPVVLPEPLIIPRETENEKERTP